MQTDTDVQALLQSDKTNHYGAYGELVMSQQTLRKAYKMSDKLPRIQAIIEATEDVLQRYADKEVKTIAMATAYEHIREIMNERTDDTV